MSVHDLPSRIAKPRLSQLRPTTITPAESFRDHPAGNSDEGSSGTTSREKEQISTDQTSVSRGDLLMTGVPTSEEQLKKQLIARARISHELRKERLQTWLADGMFVAGRTSQFHYWDVLRAAQKRMIEQDRRKSCNYTKKFSYWNVLEAGEYATIIQARINDFVQGKTKIWGLFGLRMSFDVWLGWERMVRYRRAPSKTTIRREAIRREVKHLKERQWSRPVDSTALTPPLSTRPIRRPRRPNPWDVFKRKTLETASESLEGKIWPRSMDSTSIEEVYILVSTYLRVGFASRAMKFQAPSSKRKVWPDYTSTDGDSEEDGSGQVPSYLKWKNDPANFGKRNRQKRNHSISTDQQSTS